VALQVIMVVPPHKFTPPLRTVVIEDRVHISCVMICHLPVENATEYAASLLVRAICCSLVPKADDGVQDERKTKTKTKTPLSMLRPYAARLQVSHGVPFKTAGEDHRWQNATHNIRTSNTLPSSTPSLGIISAWVDLSVAGQISSIGRPG
jgi:hypothetical protein